MLKLRRIAFSNVGYKDAFFEGEIMSFVDQQTDEPVDTILRALNGSGKTSTLALFFSTFDTEKRRFLTTLQKKSYKFEQYVTSQPGLIVAEWQGDNKIIVTGQVVIMRGDELQRTYFSFDADEAFNMLTLPWPGLGVSWDHRMRSQDELTTWLRNTREAHRDSHDFYKTSVQNEWHQRLDLLGIDTQMLSWMVNLNKTEGGIQDFVKFDEERQFVSKFLEMVLPKSADEIRNEMVSNIDHLSEGDTIRQSLEMARTLQGQLVPFAEASSQHIEATENLADLLREEAGFHDALEIERDRLKQKHDEDKAEKKGLQAETTQTAAQLSVATTTKEGVDLATAEQAATAAVQKKKEAAADAASAKNARDLLSAASAYQPIRVRSQKIMALQASLLEAEHGLDEPRAKTEHLGDIFHAVLEERLSDAQSRRDALHEKRAQAQQAEDTGKQAEKAARAQREDLARSIERVQGNLKHAESAFAKLVGDGLLDEGQGTTAAVSSRESETRALQEIIEQTADIISDLDDKIEAVDIKAQANRQTILEANADIHAIEKKLEEAAEARRAIARTPLIVELTHDENIDPESPAVARVLLDEVAKCERDIQRAQRNLETNQEDLDSVTRHALASIDRNVDEVVNQLRAAGIRDAMPYVVWLAEQNVSPQRIRDMVGQNPAVLTGVAVPTEAMLEQARAIAPSTLSLTRPVVVSVASLDVPVNAAGHVYKVDRAEAYDRQAAKQLAEKLEAAKTDLEDAIAQNRDRSERCRKLHRQIEDWIGRWGDGKIAALRTTMEDTRAKRVALEADAEMLKDERDILRQKKSDRETQAADAKNQITQLSYEIRSIQAYINDFETNVQTWRDNLQQMNARRAGAADAEATAAEQIEEARSLAAATLERLRDADVQIQTLSAEQASIAYRANLDIDHANLPTLADARSAYQSQASAFEAALEDRLGSVKANLDVLRSEQDDALKSFRKAYGRVTDAVENTAALEDVGERLKQAQATADALNDAAVRAKTLADLAEQKALQMREYLSTEAIMQARELGSLDQDGLAEKGTEIDAEIEALNRRQDELSEALNVVTQRMAQREPRLNAVTSLARRRPDETKDMAVEAKSVDLESDTNRLDQQALDIETRRKKAQKAQNTARVTAQRILQAITKIVLEQKFQMLLPSLSSNLSEIALDEAMTEAKGFEEKIASTIQTYEHDLLSYRDTEEHAVNRLEWLLSTAISLFRRAADKGKVPANVPRFGGYHVLKMNSTVSSVPQEQKHMVARRYLERLLEAKRKPESGHALASELVDELRLSLNRNSIGLQIIKPNDVGEMEYTPVHDLRASGGQTLTAALLLWVTLCRLRAETMAEGNKALGGVLVMDNPIGTVSHTLFLQVQRSIAEAMGIQLVFTTGLKDFDALGTFPHIIQFKKKGYRPAQKRTLVQVAHEHIGEPPRQDDTRRGPNEAAE